MPQYSFGKPSEMVGLSLMRCFGRTPDISGLTGLNSGRSNIDNGTRRRILRVTLAWSTLIIAALARYYGRDGVYQLSEWVTGLSLRL